MSSDRPIHQKLRPNKSKTRSLNGKVSGGQAERKCPQERAVTYPALLQLNLPSGLEVYVVMWGKQFKVVR